MGSTPVWRCCRKERHHRAARADYVAVAHHRKAQVARALHVVGRHEELIGAQLGGAVEVDGRGGLVGAQRHHVLHAAVEGGVDHVFGPENIGFDALHRVVFGGGHLLEGGGVNHNVDALAGAVQALAVAHIADEIADGRVLAGLKLLAHLVLLQLIAREHHQPLYLRKSFENGADELLAERAGAARNEDGFVVEVESHEKSKAEKGPQK